jgi:hypothetical protein
VYESQDFPISGKNWEVQKARTRKDPPAGSEALNHHLSIDTEQRSEPCIVAFSSSKKVAWPAGCSHYNLTVEPGKRYRLRLINGGSLSLQTFYVEGHNLTIVAADATPTDPIQVSSVDLNVGQR